MKENELPPCCYVCKHEKPEGWCELLNKSFKEIHTGKGRCPPDECPLRKEDEDAKER